MLPAASALAGLAIGSYVGLLADRVPRGEPTAGGRSRCDSCGRTLRWFELVPVVSWLAQGGRCRSCRAPVAARSTVIELATAALFALMAWRFGWRWELGGFLVLSAALVALAAIDLATRRLPRSIVHAAAAAGLPFLVVGALAAGEPERVAWSLTGGAGAVGAFFLLHAGWPGAMGDGDVRLAGLLGAFLGWIGPLHVPVGLFLGFVAGALVGVALLVAGRAGRKTALPFGPFLALGALTAIAWGHAIIDAWLGA